MYVTLWTRWLFPYNFWVIWHVFGTWDHANTFTLRIVSPSTYFYELRWSRGPPLNSHPCWGLFFMHYGLLYEDMSSPLDCSIIWHTFGGLHHPSCGVIHLLMRPLASCLDVEIVLDPLTLGGNNWNGLRSWLDLGDFTFGRLEHLERIRPPFGAKRSTIWCLSC